MDVLVHFGRDVAGIRRKQERVLADAQVVCRFRQHVQIAMLAEKWNGRDRAAVEGDFLHFGELDHILKAALLEEQLERRVLQRAAPIAGNHDIADPVPQLKQRLKEYVVLMVMRDQDVVDRFRKIFVCVARDVVLVRSS